MKSARISVLFFLLLLRRRNLKAQLIFSCKKRCRHMLLKFLQQKHCLEIFKIFLRIFKGDDLQKQQQLWHREKRSLRSLGVSSGLLHSPTCYLTLFVRYKASWNALPIGLYKVSRATVYFSNFYISN